MASGPATRIARRLGDGTIKKEGLVKNADGSISKIDQIIIDSSDPVVPQDFAQEIINLINNGDVTFPSGPNQYIVNISDQLEVGKYNYSFVDNDGNQKISSDIYRIFYNGINVTRDVNLSNDKKTFTFSNLYDPNQFDDTSVLIIDFTEGGE